MRHLTALLFSLLPCTAAFAQNKIMGKWKDAEHPEKQLEIYLQNDK